MQHVPDKQHHSLLSWSTMLCVWMCFNLTHITVNVMLWGAWGFFFFFFFLVFLWQMLVRSLWESCAVKNTCTMSRLALCLVKCFSAAQSHQVALMCDLWQWRTERGHSDKADRIRRRLLTSSCQICIRASSLRLQDVLIEWSTAVLLLISLQGGSSEGRGKPFLLRRKITGEFVGTELFSVMEEGFHARWRKDERSRRIDWGQSLPSP